MARPARGSVRVEGLEHLKGILTAGKLLQPAWKNLMQRQTAHMLTVAKARAPRGDSGRLAGGFTTKLHGGVNPFWGVIKNEVTSGKGAAYPLYLDKGSRRGVPYRLGGTRKRTRGWASNVVRMAAVRTHLAGLLSDVVRAMERKWRR